MSDNRKDLPPSGAANFNEKVREALSTYLGNRGNRLDRGLTLRDLVESNLVKLRAGFLANGGGNPIAGPGDAMGGSTPYEPDLTPPPVPTGFVATATISNIIIEHDEPLYPQGHGHAKTVVYGATWTSGPLPTFSDAVQLTEFTGTVFAHPTNPSTTWHLWIKWVTVDEVESPAPAGGTNGLVVTTGLDVSAMVAAMTGPGNPFTILAVDTIINGVTYPAGTYTTKALIFDAQISNAKIANLAVDDAKIASLSAAKLTAGSIAVGQYIQGTGYVAGSAGWRINGDGTAEFNNVAVRGGVYAAYGAIGGAVIESNAVRSSNYAGWDAGVGWRLGSDGTLQIPNGSVKAGSISVSSLSAITANIGYVNTGMLDIHHNGVDGGEGYVRSAGYWYRNGNNGWILARNNADVSYISFRGGPCELWMHSSGDAGWSSPGISMTNGGLTISQLNVIKTANIAGNAVTVSASASGYGVTIYLNFWVPANESMPLLLFAEATDGRGTVYVDGVNVGETPATTVYIETGSFVLGGAATFSYLVPAVSWGRSVTVSMTPPPIYGGPFITVTVLGTLR